MDFEKICIDMQDLRNKIDSLVNKYSAELNETFKDKLDFKNLSDSELDLLKNSNYLIALKLVGSYENIQVSESRGLTAYHKSLVEPVIELKPSGEESAVIHLWSGTEKYQEKFERKHEVLK